MIWDDGLEGPARQVAADPHSPLRILAGPGTGKTFVLMRRVARLLAEGTNPERLLVSTFTRTAAADLRNELQNLGVDGIEGVGAETLHALCFRILQRREVLTLTGRSPRPLLDFEQRFLLEDLKAVAGGVRKASKAVKAFAAAWARLQHEEPGWPERLEDKAFQQALSAWLIFHEAMLIGEVVPETLRYLRENPLAPERGLQEHVLVDEYQDLNRAEQVLLDLLSTNATLTVVGDEDQSIYSFKHAHPQGIAQFDQHHASAVTHRLQECRRCPQLVTELANRLISNNTQRQPRVLRPYPASPTGEVLVVQWPSVEAEAAGLAEFIWQRVASGSVTAGHILVLTPRRQFGYAIRDALTAKGTPAHSFFQEEALEGDPKDLEASEAQQAFTLLTLLAHPNDRVALRAWCGFGSPSLNAGAWARIRAHCTKTGDAPRAALDQLDRGDLVLPNTGALLARYRALKAELARLAEGKGQALADLLFSETNPWAEPIRSALDEPTQYPTARKLHAALVTAIAQPELPTDVDYVRIMSLHKSKGLTADLVVVAGCVEGLIPTWDDDATPQEIAATLEEQRRLFYVAMTRPRRTLVLSSVIRVTIALAYKIRARIGAKTGGYVSTIPSRFLDELGPSRPAAIAGHRIVP